MLSEIAWLGPLKAAKGVNAAYGTATLKCMRSLILALTPPAVLKVYRKLKAKPHRFKGTNLEIIKNFPFNFKVIDFELIDTTYGFDLKWGWWSRVYEYELVLQKFVI